MELVQKSMIPARGLAIQRPMLNICMQPAGNGQEKLTIPQRLAASQRLQARSESDEQRTHTAMLSNVQPFAPRPTHLVVRAHCVHSHH